MVWNVKSAASSGSLSSVLSPSSPLSVSPNRSERSGSVASDGSLDNRRGSSGVFLPTLSELGSSASDLSGVMMSSSGSSSSYGFRTCLTIALHAAVECSCDSSSLVRHMALQVRVVLKVMPIKLMHSNKIVFFYFRRYHTLAK